MPHALTNRERRRIRTQTINNSAAGSQNQQNEEENEE